MRMLSVNVSDLHIWDADYDTAALYKFYILRAISMQQLIESNVFLRKFRGN